MHQAQQKERALSIQRGAGTTEMDGVNAPGLISAGGMMKSGSVTAILPKPSNAEAWLIDCDELDSTKPDATAPQLPTM
jgi:hypothetical protein